MWLWKKRNTNEVVSQDDYEKLPLPERAKFSPTVDHKEATHEIIDRGDEFFVSPLSISTIATAMRMFGRDDGPNYEK